MGCLPKREQTAQLTQFRCDISQPPFAEPTATERSQPQPLV